MIALFSIISLALAYPYGFDGYGYGLYGYPMMAQTASTSKGSSSAKAANPYARALKMLDQMVPGLGSNPQQLYMWGDMTDSGDLKEAAEQVMKGDPYEAFEKLDFDFYPYASMMPHHQKKSSSASSTATTKAPAAPAFPSYYWMYDLSRPRVQPVSPYLRAPRQTVTTSTSTGTSTGTAPMNGMAGAGGMYNPFQWVMGFLNQLLPGLNSSPQNFYMYNEALDGNIGEAAEKMMQGDISEGLDKLDFDFPFFPGMMQGMGGAHRTGGASTTSSSSGYGGFNPFWYDMISLNKVRPVSPYLRAPRQMPSSTTGTTSTNPYASYNPYGFVMQFLNQLLPGLTSSPQNFYMYNEAMDGNIGEAAEKMMQGDFSEGLDKLDFDYPFFPGMFGGAGRRQSAGAGAHSSAGTPSSTMSPYMYSFIDLQKANPQLSKKPRTFIQPVIYPNGAVRYFPVTPVEPKLSKEAPVTPEAPATPDESATPELSEVEPEVTPVDPNATE